MILFSACPFDRTAIQDLVTLVSRAWYVASNLMLEDEALSGLTMTLRRTFAPPHVAKDIFG